MALSPPKTAGTSTCAVTAACAPATLNTSVWRENLDGGLEYLKEVILEDSLGINDELERQMQTVVDTYQCEWADAISDPEKLKRFRSFVNDDRPDPSIIMTSERGQLRPA